MTYIALADYVGAAEPLDATAVAFVAKPGTSCRSCVFNGQRSHVCRAAGEEAQRRGVPDCDDGFVYVRKEIDARQLSLVPHKV